MAGSLIRSVILDGAAELNQAHGVRSAALARRAGLPAAALKDPDLLVPAVSVLRFFELSAQACQRSNWGLTLAGGKRLAALIGPLWVLLRNARTVGQMCTELVDNFDLYSDAAVMGFERDGEGALLSWGISAGQHASEVQMGEFSMCVFANEVRSHLPRGWMPSAVMFRHARPAGSLALHRAQFGSDLRFNQERTALRLDRATLDAPLRSRGPAARALASRVVRLEDESASHPISPRVEAVIRSLLPYAPCTVSEVARALDLAPRTLQLRLQHQGSSFSALLDRVRADLAAKYLRHSNLSAGRIAEILGYTDATSFSRSFRRWNGSSLRALRARGG